MLCGDRLRAAAGSLACASMLLALTSLTGCASAPRVVTQVRTVEVPVEVMRPVPPEYTDALPYPAPLGDSITVEDLVEQLFDAYDVLDRCNADRASVKLLGE